MNLCEFKASLPYVASKFQDSLGFVGRPCLKKNKQQKKKKRKEEEKKGEGERKGEPEEGARNIEGGEKIKNEKFQTFLNL